MLNRTIQMLSANANALNLGTRSAAQAMGINMVKGSPRLRHAHLQPQGVDTVRTETPGMFGWPPITACYSIPEISGSPRTTCRLDASSEVATRAVVAEAPPLVRPVVADEPAVRSGVAKGAPMPKSSEAGPKSPRALWRAAAAPRLRRAARAARAGAAEARRTTFVLRLAAAPRAASGG